MKWKVDSIEQFVRYKIEHPQESFHMLKDYEAQKKHNDHIDKLYKELNKYRSELNHFKSQLFKLNQASQRQIVDNEKQVRGVNDKIELIGDKFVKAKSLLGMSFKQRKQLIVKEYQEKVKSVEMQQSDEEIRARKEVDEMERRVNDEMSRNRREVMVEKIEITQNKIMKKVKQRQTVNQKQKVIKRLSERYDTLRQQVNSIREKIIENKSARDEAEKARQQLQKKQINSTRNRIQKFRNEFTNVIQAQVSSSAQLTEQGLINYMSESSLRDRKWNQVKQNLFQGIQTMREYLRRIEYYLANNLNSLTSDHQELRDSFKDSEEYLAQFKGFGEIRALSESSTYQSHLKTLVQRTQLLKTCADQFFVNQQKQIENTQTAFQIKEKQLDKEITQLQGKVNKTDLEINKFLKNKF